MVKYSAASLSHTFSALADPTRRWILEQLGRKDYTVSELAAPLRMSLPAVSKHLKILENAGLLTRTRKGRQHQLRARQEALSDAASWIAKQKQFWDGSFDRLDVFLESSQQNNSSEKSSDTKPNHSKQTYRNDP